MEENKIIEGETITNGEVVSKSKGKGLIGLAVAAVAGVVAVLVGCFIKKKKQTNNSENVETELEVVTEVESDNE